MHRPRALVTGITGQDGSYLAELLLEKGYEVHGMVRRTSTFNRARIDPVSRRHNRKERRLLLHYGDMGDGGALIRLVREIRPDEVYNLAAQSHVSVSFQNPEYTADVVGLGPLRLLEAIRQVRPEARFYQASSSEMFGKAKEVPQDENTPFHPRSPYGTAKAHAYWCTVNYREAYGIHASNGILFNPESPRRGENFVTRKISRGVARIKRGLDRELVLGNLDARRDWGYAREYVEAMWLMARAEQAGDYVVATGETHSVRDFLEAAFGCVDLRWEDHVRTDPRYVRPAEVDVLQGDASRAREALGWRPRTDFADLVRIMVEADLEALG